MPISKIISSKKKYGNELEGLGEQMIIACIFDLGRNNIADTVESIAVVGNRLLSHYGLKEQPGRKDIIFLPEMGQMSW